MRRIKPRSINGGAIGRPKDPVTNAVRTVAFELRLQGWTFARIAKEIGISRQRIQQLTTAPAPIRFMVKQRASGRCEMCSLDVSIGHVHHKSCEFEKPSDYNDLSNLQYLCASCHRRAHSKIGAHERTI